MEQGSYLCKLEAIAAVQGISLSEKRRWARMVLCDGAAATADGPRVDFDPIVDQELVLDTIAQSVGRDSIDVSLAKQWLRQQGLRGSRLAGQLGSHSRLRNVPRVGLARSIRRFVQECSSSDEGGGNLC